MLFIQKSAVFLMLFYTVFGSNIPGNENASKKFRVIEKQVNWHRALFNCFSQGMTLATIESQQEQDQLEEYLKTYNGTPKGNSRRWWIGGADLHKDREFVWMSTGKAMNYTNFHAGQPTYEYKGVQEHCLELWGYGQWNYKWNDNDCSSNKYTICEFFQKP